MSSSLLLLLSTTTTTTTLMSTSMSSALTTPTKNKKKSALRKTSCSLDPAPREAQRARSCCASLTNSHGSLGGQEEGAQGTSTRTSHCVSLFLFFFFLSSFFSRFSDRTTALFFVFAKRKKRGSRASSCCSLNLSSENKDNVNKTNPLSTSENKEHLNCWS